MTLTRVTEENIQTVVLRGSVVLLALMTVGGLLTVSTRFAWSVLAGGILVLANHCWLKNILGRVLGGQAENAARYAFFRYLVRLTLIAIAVIVLFRLHVDIAGLFAGLSTIVITTILVSIYLLVHHKGEAS
jgi:hypothetical protein